MIPWELVLSGQIFFPSGRPLLPGRPVKERFLEPFGLCNTEFSRTWLRPQPIRPNNQFILQGNTEHELTSKTALPRISYAVKERIPNLWYVKDY